MGVSQGIKAETFSADYERKGPALIVKMRGNADMAVHDQVKAFLDGVHHAARSAAAAETVFELGELYFMNSSCLSLMLRFINAVMELDARDQYRVRLRSNRNLRWQTKSLAALQAYAPDVVVIE
jgi:hypothetical protein